MSKCSYYILMGIVVHCFSVAANASEYTGQGAPGPEEIAPYFCTRENPTVTLQTPNQSVVELGQILTYMVSIKNNDFIGCLPARFNLSARLQTGLSASFSVKTLNLNPGQSGTFTIQLKGTPTVESGSFNFSVVASNAASSTNQASASGVYTIALPSPCARAVPTVLFKLPNQIATSPGQVLSYIVSVTNNDASTCGTSVFTLLPTVEAGLSASLNWQKLILKPGQTSTSLVQVTSAADVQNRSYSISVTGTNEYASQMVGTATGSYTMNSSTRCRKDPEMDLESSDPSLCSDSE